MFVCVFNPVSGKGKGRELAHQLAAELDRRGQACRTIATDPDPAVFRAACAQIAATDQVICIGGDGTLLYFLNHASQYAALAFYGMGTANVISIEFNLPRNVPDFAEMLMRGHSCRVYPGRLQDGTRFLMMASAGIDAEILRRVRQPLKNRFGKFAFVPASLSALFRYRYPAVQLALDGGESRSFAMAVICRFRHYGGSFRLAPAADPCAGQFQVVALAQPGFLGLLRFFLALVTGRPHWFGLYCAAASRVEIRSAAPVQVDGDYHAPGMTALEVCSSSFELIVP